MFKVLLYSDGSQQSFNAAVYTAILLKNMPNIHLTIAEIKETDSNSGGIEYSWKELRPKFKRFYWGRSMGTDYCWKDSYPLTPDQEWKKRIVENYALENYEYRLIRAKTNEIFSEGLNVKHVLLCSNTNIADKADTAELILDYAKRNSFGLIIMGEKVTHTLNYFKFGDLAHSVQTKSTIPVVLVKKLSPECVDMYLQDRPKAVLLNENHLKKELALSVVF